jgi:two-component system, OmpR family, response regulator QseB
MRVLIVEDDEILLDGLKTGLALEGFTADAVETIEDAKLAADAVDYDAVVLDIALPDGSGLELLRSWRLANIAIPVLLLTARNSVRDRIGGLDEGADDYLGKPFDLYELAARIRAIARRAKGQSSTVLRWRGIELDVAAREVRLAEETVALSRREFAILQALMEQPGKLQSRAQLEDRLYGWQEEVGSNAVEVHIHNLRTKLGRELIETVRGEGYRVPRI